MIIVKPQVIVEKWNPEALKNIERYGRVCYKSEDKITDRSNIPFAEMLLERGHESVTEHEHVTVRFIIDRGVSHELVRHRLASFSQESTRYCNYGKDKFDSQIRVIQPPGLSDTLETEWIMLMRSIERTYIYMLNQGVSPQIARSVLPTCLKTEIVVTANLREWRHVLKLRTSKAAHPQMRQVMVPLLRWFQYHVPVLFEPITALPVEDAAEVSESKVA